MCNCRAELQTPEGWKLRSGEVAQNVSIDIALAEINKTFQAVTCSRMELTFATRKKPVIQSIAHSFCPWCGRKYGTTPEQDLHRWRSLETEPPVWPEDEDEYVEIYSPHYSFSHFLQHDFSKIVDLISEPREDYHEGLMWRPISKPIIK